MHCDSIRKKSWRRIVAVSPSTGSRQIFRERGVDISVPHLVRTVRRFVDEEEQATGKASAAPRRSASDSSPTRERHPESAAAEETKPKAPVTYQVSEQPSTRVQEEELAKERRRAGRAGQKVPSSGSGRGEKQRSGPSR